MTYSTIIFEKLEAVARITLNRPERANALNGTMLGEIGSALDDAEQDATVRAIIVQGAGAAFSSGFDLKEQMERRPTGIARVGPSCARTSITVMRFWQLPEADHCRCAGACRPLAGPELALACDLTIAADDAFFGEPELKFGRWHRGDDPAVAGRTEDRQEIILLGEDRIPAARAKEIGIVNRIVPAAELEGRALAMARHIATIDPSLVKRTKQAINRAIEAQGMLGALEEALTLDLVIEGEGCPDKVTFMIHAPRGTQKRAGRARYPHRPPRTADPRPAKMLLLPSWHG
jgi:enoyl-CoA hydratase/carnithine racemase